MPDFTFTSPDGKNYTVSGPEGATKEQAFQILQNGLKDGSVKPDSQTSPTAAERGKAAIAAMNPVAKIDQNLDEAGKPTLAPSFKSAATAIGTSGLLGGALGALSPEILNGAAALTAFIPDIGPEISGALRAAGTAAAGARLAAAGSGALSGAVSETAGQVAQAAGASKGVADTARVVGGLTSPLSVAGALKAVAPAKTIYKAIQGLAGLDEGVPAAVAKAKAALNGMTEAGVPQHALHAALQKGADSEIQAAQQAADAVRRDAQTRADAVAVNDSRAAARIMSDGEARASQMVADARSRAANLNKIAQGRMGTAGKVLAQAEPALREVGQPQELSDIGNQLRSKVTQEQGAALQARSEAYGQLRAQRDAIVQQKEAAGQTIDQTAEMKDLKAYINKQTLGSVAGREAAKGMAPVTDPAILRTYNNIKEAINNRRVQTGVDELGNPTYQTFKTSFDALDQVRRKLGDVLANQADAEGYGAIGKNIAGTLYDKISKVQQSYVGEINGVNLQRELQSTYHEGSEGLKKFGTKPGERITARDRLDPERFAADPSTIPKQFFSSQQGVRDLRELTGDPGLVQRAAQSYAARSLQGMSSKQVRNWMQSNSDWTREVPGLQKSLDNYATRLAKIESTAGKVSAKAEQFGKQAAAGVPEAEKAAAAERADTIARAGKVAEGTVATQKRVLEEGAKSAEEKFAAQVAPATKLQQTLQSGERPEAIRDLLLNGKPEQTRLAARIASTTSQGKQQLEDSVRQITSKMGEKDLDRQWHDRIFPMLRDGNMIPPDRLNALRRDVERVLASYKGKDKVTFAQRYIMGALGTAGANYSSDR